MLAGRRLDVVEIDSLMACLYAPRPRNHIVYVLPGAYLVVAKSYWFVATNGRYRSTAVYACNINFNKSTTGVLG